MNSCVRHAQLEGVAVATAPTDTVEIRYAEGLEVNYRKGYLELISHSIKQNSFFADTLFLKTDSLFSNAGIHFFDPGVTSIACQSSTHLAFLDVLDELDKVSGVCGLQYIQSAGMAETLKANKVVEICPGEQVQIEVLQQLNPDLFLIYPFETTGKQTYRSQGIASFYIAEYLETNPLARLEWIKLFGVLMNKTAEANAYFEEVENAYQSLKQPRTDSSETFILNLPFKESWHMPSANSLIVNLIQDAGLRYYYPPGGSTENDLHSKESVWNDGAYADYWIIMASRPPEFSMNDLLAEEPVYKTFKAVKEQRVIFCNTATSGYFQRGVVEPQVMLKDLLLATGRLADHTPVYFDLLK